MSIGINHHLHIRWEHRKTARYYRCVLQYDLLGDLLLTIAYGSIHSHRGQIRNKFFSNSDLAMATIKQISKRRQQHGYRLVFYDNHFGSDTEFLTEYPVDGVL